MEKPSSLFSSKNGNNDKPIQFQAKNISILVLVISIPILYVSFLHIPPSTLFKDTTFWFLMSNSIIIFIAVDMGTLFTPSLPETCENKLYEDFVTYSKPQSMYIMEEPPNTIDKSLVVKEKLIDNSTSSMNENRAKDAYRAEVTSSKEVDKALALVNNSNYRKKVMKAKSLDPKVHNETSIVATEKTLRRSVTQEKRSCCNKSESHDYEKLSDEELNRRVEEFIRRYYREMKLQLNNESV